MKFESSFLIYTNFGNHGKNEDGGWGLHIEGGSTMYCTALNYVTLRILGEGANGGDKNACAKARKWIHDHGTITLMPSWGKFWLSVCMLSYSFNTQINKCKFFCLIQKMLLLLQVLGIVDWSGCNPLPPEFWILPTFLPMHPG